MKDNEIKELLHKYKSGILAPEEKAMLESWYISETHNSKRAINEEELDQNLNLIATRLPLKQSASLKTLWPKLAAAMVIILIASGGLYFFKTKQPNAGLQSQVLSKNDVAPGHNAAALTLASGKIIQLSNTKAGILIKGNKLTYDDGSALQQLNIEKDSPQMLAATTPRGGTYQVTLPDGTKVWLNAASSLRFPAKFTGNTRVVELTGEAYFEVAHDKARPFHVKSNKQVVEVLGTHFNINSYADEPVVKTTLLEGSVRVITAGITHKAILKPGEQATVNKDIKIATINTEAAVAWKNGDFMFRNEPLENIMRAISRWYDVEVVYKADVSKKAVWGTITKYSNVSEVLEMINLTGVANFKIENKKIIVFNKTNNLNQ